jgi:hypothetical protein
MVLRSKALVQWELSVNVRDTKGYKDMLHGQQAKLDSKIRFLGPEYLFI